MSKFSKIIIAILIIAIVAFAGYMLGNYINNNEKGKTVNSKEVNKVVNSVINEIKNSVKNEVKNSISENSITNNEIENKTDNEIENSNKEVSGPLTTLSDSQKAINMAKEEWGEDDSVTFKIDEQNEKGQFVIQVVDKNTTNVVLEYFVDINKNTIKQK